MKEGTFYFSHDYNARLDEKIKTLIRKHGMTGYGIYWAIVEDLYNNANALRKDYEGIAYELRSNVDIVKSVINDFELFVFDDDFFGSKSVERRLIERIAKSNSASKAANIRWGNANALQPHSDSNAINKGKEKKLKEIISASNCQNEVDELLKDELNLQQVAMQRQTDLNEIKIQLTNFVAEQKLVEKTWKNKQEFRRHFLNWIRLQKPPQKEQPKGKSFKIINSIPK